MKKLLVSLMVLLSLSLQAGGKLRIKEVMLTNNEAIGLTFNAELSIEGGQAPYTYTLEINGSPVSQTLMTQSASFLDINDGNVPYSVVDNLGNMISGAIIGANITVGNNFISEMSVSYIHPCEGSNNGEITIGVNRGFSRTIFLNGVASATGVYTQLTPDLYDATVTEQLPGNNSVSVTVQSDLLALDPVVIIPTPTDTTCGEQNGSIKIDSIEGGGCEPYTVTLTPGGQSISFPTADTFSGLEARMYSLTALSNDGCEGTTRMDISVGDSVGVTIENVAVTDPACSETKDGSVTVVASSPAMPLTFMLDGQTIMDDVMAEFTGLSAGMYMLVVTDNNNCSASQMVNVMAPLPLEFTCMTGGACGQLGYGFLEIITVSGGTALYEGCVKGVSVPEMCMQVPGTFNNLPAELYEITVTDANGCTSTKQFRIEELTGVMITDVDTQNITCNGFNDGSIKVTTSPVTDVQYDLFENGMLIDSKTSATGIVLFENLLAGSYTVKVTNVETKCTAEAMTTISEPAPLRFALDKTDTTCAQDNGEILITRVTGGTPEYEFSIGGAFQLSPVFTGLVPGDYEVTVKDSNGCLTKNRVRIEPSRTVVITKVDVEAPTCPNIADGSITVFAQSPVSKELTYILTGQENREQTSATGSATFIDLSSGFYMIQAVDEVSGCEAHTRVELPEISPIRFRRPEVTPVTCKGASNGTITLDSLQITGGAPPYSYSIGTKIGFIPTGEPFMNLEAGTYVLTVRDANGCLSKGIRVVVEPAAKITICKVCTTPAHCPINDGTIKVVAKSAVPLQYAINNSPFQKEPLFTGLAPGEYRVIVNREGDDKSECTTCCTTVKRSKKQKEC